MPCRDCTERADCKQPCVKVEEILKGLEYSQREELKSVEDLDRTSVHQNLHFPTKEHRVYVSKSIPEIKGKDEYTLQKIIEIIKPKLLNECRLTKREKQVARFILKRLARVEGIVGVEIAKRYGITKAAVTQIRKNIIRKAEKKLL